MIIAISKEYFYWQFKKIVKSIYNLNVPWARQVIV